MNENEKQTGSRTITSSTATTTLTPATTLTTATPASTAPPAATSEPGSTVETAVQSIMETNVNEVTIPSNSNNAGQEDSNSQMLQDEASKVIKF